MEGEACGSVRGGRTEQGLQWASVWLDVLPPGRGSPGGAPGLGSREGEETRVLGWAELVDTLLSLPGLSRGPASSPRTGPARCALVLGRGQC